MNREHPTGTERKSLTQKCGWKGGDRAAWLNGTSKTVLTGAGLLMEGVDSTDSSLPLAVRSAGAGRRSGDRSGYC
jgi:hypothetical protein